MAERRDANHHTVDTGETHPGPGAQIWHQGVRGDRRPCTLRFGGVQEYDQRTVRWVLPGFSRSETRGPSPFSPVHPTPYRSDELCEIFLLKLQEKIEIEVAIEELLNDLKQPLFWDVGVWRPVLRLSHGPSTTLLCVHLLPPDPSAPSRRQIRPSALPRGT